MRELRKFQKDHNDCLPSIVAGEFEWGVGILSIVLSTIIAFYHPLPKGISTTVFLEVSYSIPKLPTPNAPFLDLTHCLLSDPSYSSLTLTIKIVYNFSIDVLQLWDPEHMQKITCYFFFNDKAKNNMLCEIEKLKLWLIFILRKVNLLPVIQFPQHPLNQWVLDFGFLRRGRRWY